MGKPAKCISGSPATAGLPPSRGYIRMFRALRVLSAYNATGAMEVQKHGRPNLRGTVAVAAASGQSSPSGVGGTVAAPAISGFCQVGASGGVSRVNYDIRFEDG